MPQPPVCWTSRATARSSCGLHWSAPRVSLTSAPDVTVEHRLVMMLSMAFPAQSDEVRRPFLAKAFMRSMVNVDNSRAAAKLTTVSSMLQMTCSCLLPLGRLEILSVWHGPKLAKSLIPAVLFSLIFSRIDFAASSAALFTEYQRSLVPLLQLRFFRSGTHSDGSAAVATNSR